MLLKKEILCTYNTAIAFYCWQLYLVMTGYDEAGLVSFFMGSLYFLFLYFYLDSLC